MISPLFTQLARVRAPDRGVASSFLRIVEFDLSLYKAGIKKTAEVSRDLLSINRRTPEIRTTDKLPPRRILVVISQG